MTRPFRKIAKGYRDIDDLCKLVTGKPLHQVASRVMDLWGEDLVKDAAKVLRGQGPRVPADGPYYVLGIRPDAADAVVKGAFRALCYELHPDTGAKPDPRKFQEVVDAYAAIQRERHPDRPS